MRPLHAVLASLLCLASLACVAPRGGWDPARLRGYPGVADAPGSRLVDALPFLSLEHEKAQLLLCRWPTTAKVGVSLPPDVTAEEAELLGRALGAWESSIPGLVFALEAPESAQIEIVFGAEDQTALQGKAALTVSVCGMGANKGQLVHSRVRLRRFQSNLIGELQPIAPGPFLGAALHELGHALGYNGHAALGPTVMVRDVEVVKKIGRAILAGGSYRDATLSGLYALPPGFVVGTRELTSSSLSALRELQSEVAGDPRWSGPFSRVGSRWGRFFWLARGGDQAGLRVRDLANALRGGAPLELRPIPREPETSSPR